MFVETRSDTVTFYFIDKVSPFLLLTLRNPVEGMEGALFRSLLDIDCLNSLALEKSLYTTTDIVGCLEDFHTPVLSLDESIELIRRTGLDSHLLALLDLLTTDPRLDSDQDGPYSDTDDITAPHIQLEVESQQEAMVEVELETATEEDAATQVKPEREQTEQEVEPPSEVRSTKSFIRISPLR